MSPLEWLDVNDGNIVPGMTFFKGPIYIYPTFGFVSIMLCILV